MLFREDNATQRQIRQGSMKLRSPRLYTRVRLIVNMERISGCDTSHGPSHFPALGVYWVPGFPRGLNWTYCCSHKTNQIRTTWGNFNPKHGEDMTREKETQTQNKMRLNKTKGEGGNIIKR